MRHFFLHVEVEFDSNIGAIAHGTAKVDGVALDAPAVHIRELVDSLIHPGKYSIFTCGCGNALCGHVDQRIAVTHRDGDVTWRFRSPIVFWKPGMPLDLTWEEEIAAWRKRSHQVLLTFDRLAMMDEVVAALDWTLEAITDELPDGHQSLFVSNCSRQDLIEMRSALSRSGNQPILH